MSRVSGCETANVGLWSLFSSPRIPTPGRLSPDSVGKKLISQGPETPECPRPALWRAGFGVWRSQGDGSPCSRPHKKPLSTLSSGLRTSCDGQRLPRPALSVLKGGEASLLWFPYTERIILTLVVGGKWIKSKSGAQPPVEVTLALCPLSDVISQQLTFFLLVLFICNLPPLGIKRAPRKRENVQKLTQRNRPPTSLRQIPFLIRPWLWVGWEHSLRWPGSGLGVDMGDSLRCWTIPHGSTVSPRSQTPSSWIEKGSWGPNRHWLSFTFRELS